MKRTKTISFRLTTSFVGLFLLLLGFGLAGLFVLKVFNQEASGIRDRWLRSTRYLGDLNNYTSDFRAVEATFLLGKVSENAPGAGQQEKKRLDETIMQAERDYESVAHDDYENKLYGEFRQAWERYHAEAERVFSLASENRKSEAVAIFLTSSKELFLQASILLEQLSGHNNLRAQEASEREGVAIQAAWVFLSAGGIVTAIVALVILLYVKKCVIRPIEMLAECMRTLSSGEMDVVISGVDKADELGEMARAVTIFRSHAIDLRVSQLGLASQAKMLEEKLAHEQRLNEQQRNFISMASHEFRTPMTVIDGHAQRILNTQEIQHHDKILERARKIRSAIKRMNTLIENILQVTRVFESTPNLYLHKNDFDIRRLVHEVCKLHREISPHAFVIEELGEQVLNVCADRDLIYQVCSNILANSIKYTARGRPICVTTKLDGDRVAVIVQDEGIGIPKEDIDHIFERYYRGRNVSSIVGTGIGLCFVKIVVDMHEGAIEVKSDLGKGSVFAVSLPKTRA
jgi:two-component system, OmpR family, sensor kinase